MMRGDLLAAFNARAQEQMEELWPGEISLDSGATWLACASAVFRDGERDLAAGGFPPDYAVTFRVRTAVLGATLPQPGRDLQWRRVGETPARGTLRIGTVGDPANTGAAVLTCHARVR